MPAPLTPGQLGPSFLEHAICKALIIAMMIGSDVYRYAMTRACMGQFTLIVWSGRDKDLR